jgi:hypothetical protein
MIGEVWDLEDPIDSPIENYRQVAQAIEDVLERGRESIALLAGTHMPKS